MSTARFCGPMAVPGNGLGQLILRDPVRLHTHFPEFLESDWRSGDIQNLPRDAYRIMTAKNNAVALDSDHVSFTDPKYDEPGTSKQQIEIEGGVHTIEEDLVIAGCGTSGVGAAYHCGRIGLSPLVIDNALEVGGTNTVGGVTNLWFGRNTQAFKDFYRESGATNDGLNASPFFRAIKRAGARLLPFTPVCGTDHSHNRVDAVYVITPQGLVRIKARQFIDATGDGSLAAWSGADYTYGSERDGIPSWGSFGNFVKGKPEAARRWPRPPGSVSHPGGGSRREPRGRSNLTGGGPGWSSRAAETRRGRRRRPTQRTTQSDGRRDLGGWGLVWAEIDDPRRGC